MCISLIFNGCFDRHITDCPDEQRMTVNVSDGHTGQLPYTGMDSIKLLSEEYDTLVCFGQGKSIFFKDERKEYTGGDCAHIVITTYGGYKIIFTGPSCIISETYNLHPSLINEFTVDYKGIKDTFNFSNLGARYSNETPYYDSIKIGNKYYYGVNLFVQEADSLFLNKTVGFLYFKTPNYSLVNLQ